MSPDLVSPSGQPLVQDKKLIVVKEPRHVSIHPGILQQMSKVTGCAIIEIPMDSEVLMGDIAVKELDSLHHGIHSILSFPDVTFTKEELLTLYASMRFLCEKTAPTDGSNEVHLLKKIKSAVE